MSVKKAALIEIYDSHDVNLYSQLLFLTRSGYEVTLICSERIKDQIKDYDAGQETIYVNCTTKKGLALWKELWKIRSIILARGIQTVIFNTAHSNPVRNFCLLPFPHYIRFYGTLHGVNKLTGSLTQKIISRRINSYYLLSDYMMEKAKQVPHEGLRFGIFYPIFHPHFRDVQIREKPEGTVWIAIPGAVEYKRRDYLTLIEHLARLKVKPRIQFLLLGNGDHPHGNGPEVRQRVKELELEDYFLFFSGFMENAVFHKYIKQSDAIIPLIHPINKDMEKYLENQISGSFHLAFGYKKPLLMHEWYQRYDDFMETSIFYTMDNLGQVLTDLPKLLNEPVDRFSNPKWTLEAQTSSYLRLLEPKTI